MEIIKFDSGVTQPEDKGILLKDIIEGGCFGQTYNRKEGLTKKIDKSHCLSASDYRGLNRNQNQTAIVDRDKSHCLDANYFKGGNLKSYFEKHRRQLVFSKDGLCHVGDADLNGNPGSKSTKNATHLYGWHKLNQVKNFNLLNRHEIVILTTLRGDCYDIRPL